MRICVDNADKILECRESTVPVLFEFLRINRGGVVYAIRHTKTILKL